MDLQYFPPRRDLQGYVRAYYQFSTSAGVAQPLCAELGNIRIILSGGGRIFLPGAEGRPISTAFLLGPTMGAYRIVMEAKTRVFGIGIRPRGWGALLGVNASELVDNVYDLTAIAGRIAHCAIEEVGNAADMPTMAAAADRFFAGLLERRRRHFSPYPEGLEQWLLNPNDPCTSINSSMLWMYPGAKRIEYPSKSSALRQSFYNVNTVHYGRPITSEPARH